MEDSAAVSARLLDRGCGVPSGLPPSMTEAELLVAVNHIVTVWWPQLCLSSSTPAVKDTGIFEEGWYDDNGLLDIQNPTYWKIVNGLGTLYGKVHARYPTESIHAFRVRWHVRASDANIALLVENGPTDKKDANGKRIFKGFRINGPRTGTWLDFQMELDVLRAQRDARDETIPPSDAAIAPNMVISPTGALVHRASFGASGGPAFSPAQRKDVSAQVGVALTDSVALPKSDDEQTVVQHANDAGEAAAMATTAIPDMDPEFADEDWVMVGNGDDAGASTVPVANTYKYKKEDAVKPVRGWFRRVWYKTGN